MVDESGFITACNHHFAMLTYGKPLSEVVGRHIEELIQNFCGESDVVKLPERNRQMTLSPVNNGESGTGEKALEMAPLSFLIILYCTRKSHRTIETFAFFPTESRQVVAALEIGFKLINARTFVDAACNIFPAIAMA